MLTRNIISMILPNDLTNDILLETPLNELPYTVVDLETTGSKPGVNQIIEIGIVKIENGKISNTYQTFVNPCMPIPEFISNMTGITNADVEYAPLLPDVAPDVLKLVNNSIFVAHNAAFDYTFLKKNLKLAGFEFEQPKICTVQLSRKLLPQLAHHTLDDLARHFHIEISNRHRALDDAIATGKSLLNMFDILVQGGKKVFGAITELTQPPETKKYKQLKPIIDELPLAPGVYFMKDKDNQIIYVGKSKCLQKRVRSYFYASDRKTRKLEKLVATVETIEYERTGSELSALLLESKKIKSHLPVFNKMIRNFKSYPFLKISNELFPRAYAVRDIKPDGALYYGPYKSTSALTNTIGNLQKTFKLRPCKHKINPKTPKVCLYYEMGECPGVCGGKMSAEEYSENIERAKSFLTGNENHVILKLQHEIDKASENLEFEKAAELRDNLLSLQRLFEKQQHVVKSVRDNNAVIIENGVNKNTHEVFLIKNGILHSTLQVKRRERPQLTTHDASNYRYSYLQKGYNSPQDTFSELYDFPETTLSQDEYSEYHLRKKQENRDMWNDTINTVYANKNSEIKITKENIDDLMIISTWLMQNKNRPNVHFLNDLHATETAIDYLSENFILE